jgi:hypothetical protein
VKQGKNSLLVGCPVTTRLSAEDVVATVHAQQNPGGSAKKIAKSARHPFHLCSSWLHARDELDTMLCFAYRECVVKRKFGSARKEMLA